MFKFGWFLIYMGYRIIIIPLAIIGKVYIICVCRDALGRVIVRPVTASSSFPPYRASVKDGYAAIASDGAGPRDVVSAMTAGSQVSWDFG